MAATPAVGCYNEDEELRKAATFHPSLWGDFFLTYQPPTAPQSASMERRAGVLREEVRKIVKGSNEIPKILDLTLTLQRLGLDYNYENEIDELLRLVYNSGYNKDDLNLVSLRFYLLRKHGYDVSSDVFLKFKDEEGNFAADDTRSLLSLYNAAYLRSHGEKVLDEAIVFTRSLLVGALEVHVKSPLRDEVSLALETPLFRRVRILETRNYIPIYEKEATRDEAILELAKLNFNLLQLLYCEELKKVTLWWKQLNVESNLSFIRDRIVEVHFWVTGACSEPHYSLSRIILTKMTAYITILDDIFDTYGTTEESMMLADAMYSSHLWQTHNISNRWTSIKISIEWNQEILHYVTDVSVVKRRCNENAAVLLPEYMKDFYLYLLKTFDSCEDELGPNKSYRVLYLKESLKMLVRGYSQEIKWRDEHHVPKTIKEHLKLSRETSGAFQLTCSSFVGMGDIITKGTLDWLLTNPELLKSFATFVRLSNDIASTKREQTGEHHASTVQCYMLQHGTTMHDACEKIKELIEDSWKDMVKQYLTLTEQPTVVARTVVDFARTADYMYKRTDAFTFSDTIKDMIESLYVEPLPL